MKITHNNTNYILDVDKSLQLGILKEEHKTCKLELTQDEAAVLFAVLRNVGGSPNGARGQIDIINNKLVNASTVGDIELTATKFDLTRHDQFHSFYFKY